MHKGDSLLGGGIVEGNQVDHTVLGTVGSCILKVLLIGFNNTALQHSKTEMH